MNTQEITALRNLIKSWQDMADMHSNSLDVSSGNDALSARIKALRQCAGELDLTILMLTQYER